MGIILGALLLLSSTRTTGSDARLPHGQGLLEKKALENATNSSQESGVLAQAGTLVQTHTGEHVILDEHSPSDARFSGLLADRVTGQAQELDARLLALLRSLSARHPGARFELVSGYRSKKLNEMMRKKGHHVASHSQHSLGHAVDFRLILPGDAKAQNPRDVEAELRSMGWDGGIGVYPMESDWFVHADVGPRRAWTN
jgi:uncharacterized protein YcbK (DUF882 family)